jgi:hypothetical protein
MEREVRSMLRYVAGILIGFLVGIWAVSEGEAYRLTFNTGYIVGCSGKDKILECVTKSKQINFIEVFE